MNNVALLGRLTSDPELMQTSTGVANTKFSIAVNRQYNRPGEERKADFINIIAWKGTAEFICKYFHKGDMIGIEGSINTGSYQKDGQTRYTFQVNTRAVHFASNAKPSEGSGGASMGTLPTDFEEVEIASEDIPF